MLDNIIQISREKGARYIHELEYVREAALDDVIDDRMSKLDPTFECTSAVDVMEIRDILESFPTNLDEEEDEEINRILESEADLSFEEMIGLE